MFLGKKEADNDDADDMEGMRGFDGPAMEVHNAAVTPIWMREDFQHSPSSGTSNTFADVDIRNIMMPAGIFTAEKDALKRVVFF